ncbi:MAG: hypothetical protein O7G88_05040 [bacterium]|nr:hypothetical protein [bacterium]
MSLLSGVHKADVMARPFPHMVIRNVLDEALCARLVAEFPPVDVVAQGAARGSNRRFSYAASKALADERISDAWKQMLRQHISQAFLDELCHVFGEHILDLYPHFEHKNGHIDALRAGVRGVNDFHEADVLLDALICVNTPVTERPTSVRGPHVDRRDKLFTGLFYLRSDQDDSQGGDLHLFRVRDRDNIRFRGRFTTDASVESVFTVSYEQNTLVLFLNSWASIHGVTVRLPTPHARSFLVLVGVLREPLFELPQRWTRPWQRLAYRSKRFFER